MITCISIRERAKQVFSGTDMWTLEERTTLSRKIKFWFCQGPSCLPYGESQPAEESQAKPESREVEKIRQSVLTFELLCSTVPRDSRFYFDFPVMRSNIFPFSLSQFALGVQHLQPIESWLVLLFSYWEEDWDIHRSTNTNHHQTVLIFLFIYY